MKLWELKSLKSNGRPFKVDRDLHQSALDTIVSVAFEFPSNRMTIKNQIKKIESTPYSEDLRAEDEAEPYSFSDVSPDPQLEACIYLTESIGVPFQSIFPRLAHWIYLQKKDSKHAFALKEQLIRENIDRSVARIQNTPSGEKYTLKCAVDGIVLREKSTAEKNNLSPDYHKREIYDEVSTLQSHGRIRTKQNSHLVLALRIYCRWARYNFDHYGLVGQVRSEQPALPASIAKHPPRGFQRRIPRGPTPKL